MHCSMAFCGSFICHLRICTRIGSEIFLPAENMFKLFHREKKYVLFIAWLTSVVVMVRYFVKTFSASKENSQASSYIFVRMEKLFISTLNLCEQFHYSIFLHQLSVTCVSSDLNFLPSYLHFFISIQSIFSSFSLLNRSPNFCIGIGKNGSSQ